MLIKENSIVLFQGDSITDCGRNYNNIRDLGNGYAMMIAAYFSATYPELNVEFLNRGISGNRTKDLVNRWQEDCIALKPDVVSILIGINDTWRRFDSNEATTMEEYKSYYRLLLTEISNKLSANIILCEPFLLPVTEDQKRLWREDLDPKIQVVREVAQEFKATYVPFDGAFAAASAKRNPEFWAEDGVHPTKAGHALMSKLWLQAVKAI